MRLLKSLSELDEVSRKRALNGLEQEQNPSALEILGR